MCCFHGMGVRGVVGFSVKGGISLGWWYWEGRGWGRGVRRIGPGVDVSVAPGADFGFGFFEGGGWGFGFAGRHCNLERIRAVWRCVRSIRNIVGNRGDGNLRLHRADRAGAR